MGGGYYNNLYDKKEWMYLWDDSPLGGSRVLRILELSIEFAKFINPVEL